MKLIVLIMTSIVSAIAGAGLLLGAGMVAFSIVRCVCHLIAGR